MATIIAVYRNKNMSNILLCVENKGYRYWLRKGHSFRVNISNYKNYISPLDINNEYDKVLIKNIVDQHNENMEKMKKYYPQFDLDDAIIDKFNLQKLDNV